MSKPESKRNRGAYVIHPIALCQGPRDGSFFTYRMNMGSTVNSACYVWYIEGTDPRILVDAGADAAIFTAKGIPETDIISLDEGLAKLGLTTDDIGIVLVTHLHGDHIAFGNRYKNAEFIVQKTELEYARNPHVLDSEAYIQETFRNINFDVVDGEKEIVPGVSVFLSPGHTPGGQSVKINTSRGLAIIPGFCATLAAFNQTESMKHRGWEVATHLIHQDVREAYESTLRIKHEADIVLPIHDPSFIGVDRMP